MPILVNHEYKFIFHHVSKTGGTSIWHDITKLYPDTLIINKRGVPTLNPKLPMPHATSAQIAKWLSPDIYNDYFKFSFMRNPYSWIVSLYLFRRRTMALGKGSLVEGLRKFVLNFRRNKEKFQSDWLPKPLFGLTTYTGLYERLQDDFNLVTAYLGMSSIELSKHNVSLKTNDLVLDAYSDGEMLELVTELLKDDIKIYESISKKRAIDDIWTS